MLGNFKYLVLLLLVSCSSNNETLQQKSEYEMECSPTDLTPNAPLNIRRCENKEIICYSNLNNSASLSCVSKRDAQ